MRAYSPAYAQKKIRMWKSIAVLAALGAAACIGLIIGVELWYKPKSKLIKRSYQLDPNHPLIWKENCRLRSGLEINVETQTFTPLFAVDVQDASYDFVLAYYQFPNQTDWQELELTLKEGVWTIEWTTEQRGTMWVYVQAYFQPHYAQSLVLEATTLQ